MHPDDILLWPDEFWCLRQDLREEFMRDNNYQVISHLSRKWLELQRFGLVAAAND